MAEPVNKDLQNISQPDALVNSSDEEIKQKANESTKSDQQDTPDEMTINRNVQDEIVINRNVQDEMEKLIQSLSENIDISNLMFNDDVAVKPVPSLPDASKNGIESVMHALLDALQESVGKKDQPKTQNVEPEKLENVLEIVSAVTETPKKTEEEWQIREKVLLAKIAKLEEQQNDDIKFKAVELKLKLKCEENDILKANLKSLEAELKAVLSKPNGKNKDVVAKIKKQHEELLTKARGMIFDKTKMIKNQELQIEALTSQVTSLKDVVSCTKDLLNIRNMEVVHLQERLECMDLKIQAEKDRHNLIMKKMDTGTKVNEELKKEYLNQMELFKNLKLKYEEKFQVLERNQKDPPTTSAVENGEKSP